MLIKVIAQTALWVWFLGCITTYRVGKRLLVEGMGLKSAEFVMLALYSLALAASYVFPSVGKWVLLAVLLLWFIVQFFCHWYYTLFGADEKKLKGYNDCFSGTLRLFPASATRLVPDLYHIVLHLLIVLNILILAIVP